jgi:hypothetical protein
VDVSAGETAACAVRQNHRIACWGQSIHYDMKPPPGLFLQVSVGDTQAAGFQFQTGFSGSYACAIAIAHTVKCWGGDPGYRPYTRPPNMHFTAVSAGDITTCGITMTQTMLCWGYFGNGSGTFVPSGLLHHVSDLSVGEAICAVGSIGGKVACAWSTDFGEAQVFTGPAQQIAGDFSPAIGSGCVLERTGHASCWGSTSDPTTGAPGLPDGRGVFAQISVADSYACGIRPSGSLFCWGLDARDGAQHPPPGAFMAVNVGDNVDGYGCGVRRDHALACWPAWFVNGMGRVPSGAFNQVSLSQTRWFACGVRTLGAAFCWNTDSGAPEANGVTHPPSGKFVAVSAGGNIDFGYACGIKVGGAAVCWGDNHDGIRKPPQGLFTSISAGSDPFNDYACAIRVNGRIACWGAPQGAFVGQIAGAPPQGAFSQIVTGLTPCALRRNGGVLICWGQGGTMIPLSLAP